MGEDGTAGWFSIRDRQAAAPGVSAHGPSGMKTVFAEFWYGTSEYCIYYIYYWSKSTQEISTKSWSWGYS